MKNRTFSIIKPDAVGAGVIGNILEAVQSGGFEIKAMKMAFMSRFDAERFYAVHRGRPFYEKLCLFMSSGPVVVMVLGSEGDAVADFRRLVGATDPSQADQGTIRHRFAHSKTRNAIHASDSPENAALEAAFFFPDSEIFDTEYRLPVSESVIDG